MNQKDQFAQLMSEEVSFVGICDQMNLGLHDGRMLLNEILEDLGEQAQ